MTRAQEHLLALLALSPEERIEAANALFDSLDSAEEPGWEEAWSAELTRRVREAQDGARQGIDADTVRARVAERLRALRQ